MLKFTEAARETILALMTEGYVDDPALRIGLVPGRSPFAPEYEVALVEADETSAADVLFDGGGFTVLVDGVSAEQLEGATVDFIERAGESGFEIRNAPLRLPAPPTGPIAERVRQVIEERINPGVAAHGGRITLVDVTENVVYVTMSGGCQGCGMAQVTLRQGVERTIRQAVPEVEAVHDVTDHARGMTPYYEAAT